MGELCSLEKHPAHQKSAKVGGKLMQEEADLEKRRWQGRRKERKRGGLGYLVEPT